MVALAPPLRGGLVVTSPYGWRTRAGIRELHTGTDFRAPFGTPVYAAAAGVARRALNGGGGYGIVIDHGDGTSTEYWHLSARSIGSQPVQVAQGQRIGSSGASGIVTGPHLHFEVKYGGRTVDPMTALGGGTGNPTPLPGERRIAIEGRPNPVDKNPDGSCPPGYEKHWDDLSERCWLVDEPTPNFGPWDVAADLPGWMAEEGLKVLLNVAVVGGALLVGWGGLKKVIGG